MFVIMGMVFFLHTVSMS